MKKILFLIPLTVILMVNCSKEEINPAPESVTSGDLKCTSHGKFDRIHARKWMIVNRMVGNIHWIQQSCFKIEAPNEKIYTDPLSVTKTDEADIILITHPHGDHFSPADIDKLTGPHTVLIAPAGCDYTGTAKRVILKPGEVYVSKKGIKIKAVPAYNIVKTQFHPQGNNWVGYVITVNGVTIYHAGDTERIPEMQDIRCDIAMLPLGQVYTMNSVEEAAEAARDINAMVAIPMHFGLYEGTGADAQTFKDLLDGYVKVVIKTPGE